MDKNSVMQAFPIGARVRVVTGLLYKGSVGRAIRDRVGVVCGHKERSGTPLVHFEAEGKRKAYTWEPALAADVALAA